MRKVLVCVSVSVGDLSEVATIFKYNVFLQFLCILQAKQKSLFAQGLTNRELGQQPRTSRIDSHRIRTLKQTNHPHNDQIAYKT